MLQVQGLQAFYGKSQVLHGLDFQVGNGEIVALLGRNGSGRSTTAKAIMGLVQARGSVRWQGQELRGRMPYQIARLGIGYVPEDRGIFPGLTVHQNLMLGEKSGHKNPRWSFPDMYTLFPRLRERAQVQAGALSGGEQQMLTLCRTLMGDPDLLLIDEPTEGLAPQVVQRVAAFLQTLRARGLSVLLIEQKLTIALQISDRCLVMGHGRVVFAGSPAALQADAGVRKEWLEL